MLYICNTHQDINVEIGGYIIKPLECLAFDKSMATQILLDDTYINTLSDSAIEVRTGLDQSSKINSLPESINQIRITAYIDTVIV